MLVYNGLQLSILKTVFYLQHSQLLLLDFLLDSHWFFGQFLELFCLPVFWTLKLFSPLTEHISTFLDVFLVLLEEIFFPFFAFLKSSFLYTFVLLLFPNLFLGLFPPELVYLLFAAANVLLPLLFLLPFLFPLLRLFYLLGLLFQWLFLPQLLQILL